MINKCRAKIVQRELYNVRDSPWRRQGEIKRETPQPSRTDFVITLERNIYKD